MFLNLLLTITIIVIHFRPIVYSQKSKNFRNQSEILVVILSHYLYSVNYKNTMFGIISLVHTLLVWGLNIRD